MKLEGSFVVNSLVSVEILSVLFVSVETVVDSIDSLPEVSSGDKE